METLTRLNRFDLDKEKPTTRDAVLRHIDSLRGTEEYISLLERFGVTDRADALLAMAIDKADQPVGVRAANLLLAQGKLEALRDMAMADDPQRAGRAVMALGGTQQAEALEVLEKIVLDPNRSVVLRNEAVRAMGRGPAGEKRLFDLAREGRLPEDTHISAAGVLLISRDETIRTEAPKHLKMPAGLGAKPLPPIAELAKRRGDIDSGKQVYTKATCISCHRIGETGIDFGPALSEIGSKLAREGMYEAILAPSAAISFGFEAELVSTRDGQVALGYVSSETENNITVRMMGGISTTIEKSKIASRQKQPQSLMPPGLQQLMTEQELVDLVEYLMSLRKPPAADGQ